MQTKININIAVDVIAALSDKTLHNHIFLMDNSIYDSTCQGTPYLVTKCKAGQIIEWIIYAIDLQTPVSIRNITFNSRNKGYDCNNCCNRSKNNIICINEENSEIVYDETKSLDLKVWTGIVPWYMELNAPFEYTLELQMGEGKNSIMSIDSASLIRVQ